jgi:hypothetical protein
VMYRTRNRSGMGAADSWYCPFPGVSPAFWQIWGGCIDPNAPSVVAPVGSPQGPALTVPPASGVDAQATVDALVNQQMIDQQALNASGVKSSTSDLVLGSGGAVVTAVSSAVSSPWLWIGIAGLAGLALVAVGGGSPRRYGR